MPRRRRYTSWLGPSTAGEPSAASPPAHRRLQRQQTLVLPRYIQILRYKTRRHRWYSEFEKFSRLLHVLAHNPADLAAAAPPSCSPVSMTL